MKLLLHPLPVRIFHWIMFFAVMYLVITGLYMNDPWGSLPYGLVRKTHNIAGIILMLNLFGQIYYYAVTGKYTEILFTPRDLPNLRSFFRYALFITENHPNYGRYNPGQKVLFTSWGLAVLLAGLAALPYFFPEYAPWLARPFGGLMGVRITFYTITMFFLATIPLHLFLVFTEEPAKLQAMFSGYVNKEPQLKEAGE
ncbi:cytochrome b/b6 domain-containing protein [Sporomusa malonica]|uniref:Ni/Fe-hydrogenase 1 B-type cytochrome subunit n=1 Tax=Sporomusa malonica TaxID=112901 RepID=A0A1W2E350_9FIRM|nr:cytochrome b/b6 domain-containing protein [Sporomusa malonica]SMD04149.1 Ni/Fe-hydrogenase 1 B-type cytochrome subunit [Sporomusa malonica]